MDLSKILSVMSVLCFLSVVRSQCYRIFKQAVQRQEGYSWTGNFKIPRTVIGREIIDMDSGLGDREHYRDPDTISRLMENDRHWEISIKVGEVTRINGLPNIDPFRYVDMKMFCDEFSLDLAYFTNRSVHQNGVFVVDSISWSEGVITVKGGHDELVLNIEMDEDCGSRKWRRPLYESWYLRFPWSPYCDIYDIPTSYCDLAMKELDEMGREISNICFKNDYSGDSCGMSMKIMSLTGIFLEKSLIIEETPLESVSGYHLNGDKRMEICLTCIV